MPTLRLWSALSLLLGIVVFAVAARLNAAGDLPGFEQPGIWLAMGEAAALIVLAILVMVFGRRVWRRMVESGALADAGPARPGATLFLISFVALFVELMLIRYCNAQIRVFSFYKNVPLIGSFVGLGLGCCLARGRSGHALAFLAWLLPVAVFLSAGSIVVRNVLGEAAAIGSSEQILGDVSPGGESVGIRVFSQVLMAGFCVATLVVITLLFEMLGRLLGAAFEQVPRIRAYTLNILGSLAGILAFSSLSYLETPPAVWFAVGLVPLLFWMPSRAFASLAALLIVANSVAVLPSYGETVWSRYQKLVGHPIRAANAAPDAPLKAYLVQISDVFYQVAVDLRPAAVAKSGNAYPHYDAIYADIPTPQRVLIVGAGTGNDVAAALRAGAGRVDAVDIDPAIVAMGRRAHPERPYDDPRVHLVVDDARHAFRVAEPALYDLVVFGLLDSHTQLGASSVRLDNYVFTLESLESAARLIRPGGHIALTAAVFQPWLRDRFERMLATTTGNPVATTKHKEWFTFTTQVKGSRTSDAVTGVAASLGAGPALPTDDWPFIYLPDKGIPLAYIWVVLCLVIASIGVLRWRGLRAGTFSRHHGHLFFLGAAFLLMEVHAINRLALLFGTVWLVSAVTIAVVLMLIVAANLTVAAVRCVPYPLAYSALAISLGVSWFVDPSAVLDAGTGGAIAFALVLLSPVYFAGLIFARSFANAPLAAPAIGANILGSVLGGWMEDGTMAVGMRNLVLFAAGFYLLSLVLLVLDRRRAAGPTLEGRDAFSGSTSPQSTIGVPALQPEPETVGAQ